MISIKNICRLITFVILFLSLSSCKESKVDYNGEVCKVDNGKFGYKIYFKEKLYIKQENIPTISGNTSFNDSIDALKTMNLVITRLNCGKNPSLNQLEIKKLNIKIKN
jgi:hypothetical protein